MDLNIPIQPAITPNNRYGQIVASFKENVQFIDEKWESPAMSFSPLIRSANEITHVFFKKCVFFPIYNIS